MSFQYTIERGQVSMLHALHESGLPPLDSFMYETHAPYDAFAVFPTLLMNHFSGARTKFPAVTEVSYAPKQSVDLVSLIDKLATRVRIGDRTGEAYKTSAPLGGIAIRGTLDATHISFLEHGSQKTTTVHGLTPEQAMIAAVGLLYAAQDKLLQRLASGHFVSAQ